MTSYEKGSGAFNVVPFSYPKNVFFLLFSFSLVRNKKWEAVKNSIYVTRVQAVEIIYI